MVSVIRIDKIGPMLFRKLFIPVFVIVCCPLVARIEDVAKIVEVAKLVRCL
jgi:hypothetical protein